MFKGFVSESFKHEDLKRYYFESVSLRSREENNFVKVLDLFEIKHKTINKEYRNNFSKRTKVFDEKGKWVDTKPIHLNNKKWTY